MNIKQHLEHLLSQALNALTGLTDCTAQVARAKSPQFGDYQANGLMALAKRLGRNPRELAQQLCDQLDLSAIANKVEVAGPGFINIFISADFLNKSLAERARGTLVAKTSKPQTVVIDYSSPNLAKEMHVGHLRGTIIGDAIARTFTYLGHQLIRQNHFGDWGTQFGMLITYLQEHKQEQGKQEVLDTQLSDLEQFYRAAKQRFDADPSFADQARSNVVKLQAGDAECLSMWRNFIKVSMAHCEELYHLLNITLTEQDMAPESFYNDRLAGVVSKLNAKGLLSQSAGATCVFLDQFKSKEGEPLPVIIQKSDGGYLYATTDLAAIHYRCQELKTDRVLYVVDARQSLHFQQVFIVAQLAGFATAHCSLEHLSYGTMMGKDGKPFKTRSGDTVKLVDLCDESIERALQLVTSKNPTLPEAERQHIAKVIGIAAIKYADLSKNRNSDYVFDWDTMLSFEGNTAPYLLYAYARICSIFRKAGQDRLASYPLNIQAPAEQELAMKLLQFAETVETLAVDCLPNQLCLYLYELSGVFMKFYEACPVLNANNAQLQQERLGLCSLTAAVMKQGLELLGIEVLEQM
jgi:arginyl-tRNA synthetase